MMEKKPNTASRLCDLHCYQWQEHEWQEKKAKRNHFQEPLHNYEAVTYTQLTQQKKA